MRTTNKFSLALATPAPKRTRPAIPKVADLPTGKPVLVKPSPFVREKFGQDELVVGVDVETADWEEGGPKPSMHKGRFGFMTRCREDVFNQRIVQIGWAIGNSDPESAATTYKELAIKPEGFAISDKAIRFHGITNESAQKGMSLRDALVEFMAVMQQAAKQGCRVVIHNLEFDAGLIARELVNAGLDDLVEPWIAIARNGFCTMDPDVGKWLQWCKGRDFEAHESKYVLPLRHMLDLLFPSNDKAHLLKSNLHTAAADAQAHRLVYNALRSLALSTDD